MEKAQRKLKRSSATKAVDVGLKQDFSPTLCLSLWETKSKLKLDPVPSLGSRNMTKPFYVEQD
jgi:hypothetical protein